MKYLDLLRIETLLSARLLRMSTVKAFLLILFIASVPISHIQAQRENPNYFLTFDDGNPINPHYYWGQYQYDSGFVFDAGGDRDFDIRGGNGITLGPNLGDQMIDNAGDVNGDGLDDFIILGMLGEKGEAFVVFGSPGGFSGSFDLSTLDGSNGFVVNSRDDPPAFGLTVLTDLNRGRAAGDVNGDGYDDIILSASQTSYWAWDYDVGEVFILFGKSDFPASMSVSELDGSNGFSMQGGYGEWLYLGYDVSAAGDVNSDGIDDFIIATRPLHGVESPLYVVFGNNNGFDATFDLSSLDGSNGFVIGRGSEASDPGMCSAGDFNGDGIDDILIGAQTDEYDLGDRVHLIFGKPVDSSFPDTLAIPSFDGNNGFTISGLISDVKGGRSVVSSAGDVNGDGYDDILIGNQLNTSDEYVRSHNSENGIYEGVGETFVVFGGPNDSFSANTDISTLINGTDGFVVRGIVAKGQLGYSLSSADVNNDGFDDMIMGCSEGSIASFAAVLYGGTSFPDSLDLLTLHTDSTGFAIASVSGGGLGRCVSGMGDTNGDGVDDFAISSGSTAYMFYGEKKPIAPILSNPITDQQTHEDEPFSFTIPGNTFSDQNPNDIQTLSAQLTGGDALPSWLSFDPGTGTFLGTPLEGDIGTLSIEVTSSDEDDLSITDTFSLEVIANDPPVFTSSASVSVAENTTIVQTVTAIDAEASAVTFALGEGIDDHLFNIDELSGELTFVNAPDFEDPVDNDGDNIYEVVVAAFDAFENVALQNITITVTDVDESPVFTSPSSVSVTENEIEVQILTAEGFGEVTFEEILGTDAALFQLYANGMGDELLRFWDAPDFENPLDEDADNVYEIIVRAYSYDGEGEDFTDQAITINVTDVLEGSWTGTTSSDWNTATNWSSNILPQSSDDVTIGVTANDPVINSEVAIANLVIDPTASLTISTEQSLTVNGDLTNNGNLHVESGASLVTLGVVSGTDYQIDRITTFDANTGRYSIVGSPVQNAGFSVLGTSAVIYGYDESETYNITGNKGLDRFKSPAQLSQSILNPGEGYFSAFTGDANGLVSFTGIPNTGPINVPLAYTDHGIPEETIYQGFNLVSNPYPSAIDFTALMLENDGAAINGSIYLWDDNNSTIGRGDNQDYLVVNAMGNTDSRNNGETKWDGNIRSGQGFFISATAATSINFTNAMRGGTNSDASFFRSGNDDISFKLLLSNNKSTSATVIGFAQDATKGADRKYDAISLSEGVLQLYSLQADNSRKLSIQGLPFNYDQLIRLGIKAKKGENTISLTDFDGTNTVESLLLTDHRTGNVVDLRQMSYSFTSEEVSDDKRFTLQLASMSTVVELPQSLIETYGYVANDQLNIIFSNSQLETANIELVDLTGKKVLETKRVSINESRWSADVSHLPAMLYILVIETQYGVIKSKVIKE